MQVDYAAQVASELQTIQSTKDFCKDWRLKWRPIAVTAQSILSVLFPPAALVIGFLISLADQACPTM